MSTYPWPIALVLLVLSAVFGTIHHSPFLTDYSFWLGVNIGSAFDFLSDWTCAISKTSVVSSLCVVPQGPILDPLLFSLCTTPLISIIGRHKIVIYHFYADETQLYIHLSNKNSSSSFDILNRYLHDVKEWMSANKVKLNPDKTEFIVFGTKADSVRNLGLWFDADFCLSKHVQRICQSCFL